MNSLPQDNMPRKLCGGPCKQILPATPEFFSRNKTSEDGLQFLCKACTKEYKKQHYQTHKEQVDRKNKAYKDAHLEQDRAYHKAYAEAHKEHLSEYHAMYYEENKEQMLENNKQNYQENREQKLASQQAYREANKEKVADSKRRYAKTEGGRISARAHGYKRRAQKRESGGTHTPKQLREQLERQKRRCYYSACGHAKLIGVAWHADHVVPLSRGGSNSIENIVIACPDCNLRKHDKLPHEWLDGGRLL